jgi:alpha-tubulin suppressor-like RCC1 family protein
VRHPPTAARTLAALAGLLLGACGGTLHDAAGVPAVAPGGGPACDAPQHVCGGSCVAQSVTACGAGCDVCSAVDPNASAVCEPGGSGVFACGQVCQPGWFACTAGCCRATAVAAGDEHACAVTSDGGLLCWGKNDAGQLGPGAAGLLRSVRPVTVPLTGVTAVAAGGQQTCALLGSGATSSVSCWGANAAGQLGGGSTTATAAIVGNVLTGATALALGARHSCAIVGSGVAAAVWCWGANDNGQLGTGNLTAHAAPVGTRVAAGATSLSAAGDDTCAVAAGAASCWGADTEGQTGSGAPTARRSTPQPVGISGAALRVSVGRKHACATSNSGGMPLFCWGSGGEGEMGNRATATPVLSPVPADRIDSIAVDKVFVTGEAFTCSGKVGDFTMKCAGRNDQAQCGGAPTATPAVTELEAGFGGPLVAASAGRAFSCALVGPADQQVVMCWGANADGQLGRTTVGGVSSQIPDLVGK